MNKIKYYFFIYKNKETNENEIIKVSKMDYNDHIQPINPLKVKIHGSEGLFANTLEEAMKIDLRFDELMDDRINLEDFEGN